MAEHNELGKIGEGIAVAYLQKKGYEILCRNYTFKKSELDIVTKKGELLVIVEVKTRNSDYLAGPEITITKKKQLPLPVNKFMFCKIRCILNGSVMW